MMFDRLIDVVFHEVLPVKQHQWIAVLNFYSKSPRHRRHFYCFSKNKNQVSIQKQNEINL